MKKYAGWITFFSLTAILLIPVASSFAQDEVVEEDVEVVEQTEETETPAGLNLADLIKGGGVTMIPLGLLSMAMVYFIIQNAMLLREESLLRSDLMDDLEGLMARRDVSGVRKICAEESCLLTSVLDAGMERIADKDYDPGHVNEAIEEAGNEQMVSFMRPINYLSIIGQVSPMLGLFGTVSGMIKAFNTIGAGGMGKPELLAGNIGEALITTATGLVIAIPAMICYFIYKNNFAKNMSTMGRRVGSLMNAFRVQESPAKTSAVNADKSS